LANTLSIVIIDNDAGVLRRLSLALARGDVRVFAAADPEQGLEIVLREHPQLVLTGLDLPGMDGLEILDRIMAFDPAIDVVLTASMAAPEAVVRAMRQGAADYLPKPVKISVLQARIEKLLDDAQRRMRAWKEDRQPDATGFEGMVGHSEALMKLSSAISRIAPHYRSALITGETGSGKELVARALHRRSPVAAGPFVVLNCSAVVDTLFESELFGHVRGSFTGATADKMGLFEFADKGTIFLDEIGDMPVQAQAKLLRTLQHQEILRVGSLVPRRIDVRVIAATHHDLRRGITERWFREDLFYRLSMIGIEVPSLAARKEDLRELTDYFIKSFATQFGREIRGVTLAARVMLANHRWPGNIRELENVLGHACMMASGSTLDVGELPGYLRERQPGEPGARSGAVPIRVDRSDDISLGSHEKELILRALTRAMGNQSAAAVHLGIGRDALRYKMKKHGLDCAPMARAVAG